MMALIAALLAIGLAMLLASWWLRRGSGLPAGAIAYSDTDRPAQPLISGRYALVGKPDYIVLHRGIPIPIEVKPNRVADQPYEGDCLQLAAYCLLVEETNAKTPPFAVLRYHNRSFRIDYTPQLRQRVVALIAEMRALLEAPDVAPSHRSVARCTGCGFARSCEQNLAR